MSAPENPFAALLADYVAECLPQAEDVVTRALTLERAWRVDEHAPEAQAPLKGMLHTIKGNSAMMGLTPLQGLAHALEDLVELLGGEPLARKAGAALLVRGAGLLADLIQSATSGPVPSEAPAEFTEEVRAFLAHDRGSWDPLVVERRESDRRTVERRAVRPTVELSQDGGLTTIRVNSARLDALLETFGEAMIAQAGLRDAARALVERRRATRESIALDQAIVGLERTLKRLEGALMETRLLPISTLFGRFTRQVRDLAHSEQRQVRLEVAGGETQLDKTIIDRMGEPLVHLLTNAVIHGIEPPEERVARGKPAEAVIALRAVQRSDRVLLTVTDDGRGLDPERILIKARALGMAPASEHPSRAEVLALAFLPGLSTAERISAIAGRGVGLDVVAGSIRALGGQVSVTSEPGRGTTFTLRLPLTVAVLRAMLIEVNGERYALPLADVAETVRLGDQTVHEVGRQGMITWRHEVIPVVDCGEALDGGRPSTRRYCVILRSSVGHRALLVDSLLGHQEIVVKALDPALGRPRAISAATILGDGRIACILDAGRLASRPAVSVRPMTGAA